MTRKKQRELTRHDGGSREATTGLAVAATTGATGPVSMQAGRFTVSRSPFARGSLAAHFHERACLSVVLEGSFTEFFATRFVECQVAGLLCKPAGEVHRDAFHGSVHIIIEPDDGATQSIGETATLFDHLTYRRSVEAITAARRIERELLQPDRFAELAIEGLALELVACLLRSGRRRVSVTPQPAWLSRVRELLHDASQVPNVAELATLAQVNAAYLARQFRRHVGVGVGEYGRRLRLERVARRLMQTRDTISEIAFSAGFADQSHLTRAFQAWAGMTPTQYRRANASESSLLTDGTVGPGRKGAR